MHEGVEALIGLCLPLVGQVEGDHGGCELGVPQGALDEPRVHTGFEQMGGVRMPQGLDGPPHFGNTRTVFRGTEGALHTGATQRGSRCRTLFLIPSSGGKEPGFIPMGFPVGAQQSQRISGQRDVSVFGALAAMDMDLEALPVNVGTLQEEGFMEPKASTIDRGEVDLIVEGRGGLKEPPDLLDTEHGGEPVGGLRTQERESVPVAFEDVLIKESNATRAEAHGRWSKAIDVFPVEEGVLQCLFRDAVR